MGTSEITEKRVVILDTLRGFAIIAMIVQHFLFDVSYIFYDPSASGGLLTFFKFCRTVTNSDILLHFLQPAFQCLFVLISGIACRYSRSNLKRGFKACACAALLSLLTVVILPSVNPSLFSGCEIYFGILHLLGISMILWALCRKGFDRLCENKILNIAIPVILAVVFFVFYCVSMGAYNVKGLFWLGIPSLTFFSADYFPILPWTALFFIGAWIGKYIHAGRFPKRFYSVKPNFFGHVGRHTLIIYLLHQPVVFGICYLIFEILM